jgi:uncharacterized membrane protein YdbT with pleckstrin-like domain
MSTPTEPLSYKPLHFPTQRPDEHVVMLLRRHWSILFRNIMHSVLMLLIPIILFSILFFTTTFEVTPGTPLYVLIVEAISLYYLFAFLSYFHHFIDYHLDIWVVTDQRIVSVEQEGLFNRIVSELNITRVQDVTSESKGKIQTFLHYGQVHIQTAGEQQRFVFEEVPNPSEVARVILELHDRVVKSEEFEKIREGEEYRQQMEQHQPPHPDTK